MPLTAKPTTDRHRELTRGPIRRLAKKTRFILVHSSHDGSVHHVEFKKTHDDCIKAVESGTRMSTIIPHDGSPDDPISCNDSQIALTFLGPLHPTEIDPEQYLGVYATLGTFNVLLASDSDEQLQNAISLAEAFNLDWETWVVTSDGNLSHIIIPESIGHPYAAPDHLFRVEKNDENQSFFVRTEERYRVEIARALAKSHATRSSFHEELVRYDSHLREVMKNETSNPVIRLKTFTLAANALSRHSTQTYSGLSPILSSSCAIASESLLGIGLASMAIARVRRFVERVITSVRYYDRIESLRDVPPIGTHIEALLDSDHEVLTTDHLTNYGPPTRNVLGDDTIPIVRPRKFRPKERWSAGFRFNPKANTTIAVDDSRLPPPSRNIIPLINFISARDGFRASKVSLSAPADVITACNSASWSLMTLTHELSHALIDDIHARVAPIDDEEEMERIFDITTDPTTSTCLLDDISAYFYIALMRLCEGPEIEEEDETPLDPKSFVKMLQPRWRDVLEILTHTFDFIHFYLKKSDEYVRGVWSSWAVLPNIKARVEEYVVRTLCALHVDNIGRPNGLELTYGRLKRGLSGIRENPLIEDILFRMESEEFKKRVLADLSVREMLIGFVSMFCTSTELRRKLEHQYTDTNTHADGGAIFLADHRELAFTTGYIANPVRFLESMEHDLKPDAARSVWTLNMLAFEPVITELR